MTDPMTRIADALELIAVVQSRDSDGYATDSLRERILAQYTVPTVTVPVLPTTDTRALCSFGCGRVATETANGEPVCGDANACVDMKREVAPPPDDDPEWRDVPAELAQCKSIRKGDRYYRINDTWHTARLNAGPDGAGRNWIKRHDHPARKPAPVASAPETVDVMGSELRVGDVVVAVELKFGARLNHDGFPAIVARLTDGEVVYTDNDRTDLGCVHRVRLPRPAAEPSAKAKCPTCRCMIAPGSTCACCESTSGDDPPLPDTGIDVEPSASGEGIARLRHTLLEIGAHSWAVGELHDQPWLMASRIVSAINAAHANATRELRERCERAEHDVEKWHSGYLGLIVTRDALEAKLAAAIARAEAAERERDEALTEFNGVADERDRAKFERAAAIARAEAAERVVRAAKQIGSVTWNAAPAAVRVILDALDAYDAARRDGGK